MKNLWTVAIVATSVGAIYCGSRLVQFPEPPGVTDDGGTPTDGGPTDGGTADGGPTDGGNPNDGGLPGDNDACEQLPVKLGAASCFGALAGSTVTNTGPTKVTGDIGLSPGSAITGFPPGTYTGGKHINDTQANAGAANLTTAFNDAAGRSLCPVSVAGNIGGKTLPQGLYKSTSSLAISSGDLTLDAGGDLEAVWIFQIASSLTVTSGRKVILAGGAQAKNIFWQVGSSATIGTTAHMEGNIMADQSVSLLTGATLNGRALARIAAVTLDTNQIVVPEVCL